MKIHKPTKLFILIVIFTGFLATGYCVMTKQASGNTDLSIGERFHKETCISWRGILCNILQPKPSQPARFKQYPKAKTIKLPDPDFKGIRLEDALRQRRSIRNYSLEPISLSQLSQLLFAAQGITGKMFNQELRTAPSAGALYPFEIYIVANNVRGLDQGIYHYAVIEHALQLVKSGNFKEEISSAGLGQDMLSNSAVTFVLSSMFDRLRHKYGERGFRYAYMEAGHISQNISLQSVSLGLGSVTVGAFKDQALNELIGVDGATEAAIYLHAVGNK